MQASLALVWNRRNLDGYRKEKFEEYMFKKQRELEELQAQQQVEPEKGQHRWVLVQEPKDKWDQHLPLQNPPPPPSPDPTQKMRLQKLYQAAFPSPQLDQSFPPTPISPPISSPIAVEANSISPTEMFFPFRTQTIPIQHELPISHKVTNQPPTVTNAPTSPTHYSPVEQQVTKLKRTSAVTPVKSAKFLDVKFDFDFEITLDHLDPPPVYS
ncbi:hypothetical protein BDN72DRAFT_474575 [Pluteus cervinus]|uniref:Uncharacterized protein n=1 Tax=Pluteus cervinus TaxID=181527 RepID=A0ACD3AYY8_9AGAR|nr:hypothetical protein BDN72DRAFT_474575 [Pluteus cervinus]